MYQIFYVITSTVRTIVAALEFLLFARAILSWLPVDEDNPIVSFLYSVTEPVLMPVRSLIERFGWFDGMPFDMAFMITFILLSVLEMFL